MKARTAIITIAVIGAVTAGGIVTARHFGVGTGSSARVNVVPVNMVNVWWWDDESPIEGNVVSRDVQNVELNNDYDLTKVYVKEGDTVKIGDPLMEYDMSMLQLKLEVEELNGQRLELELSRNEKNLEKTLKSPGASAIYAKIEKSTETSKTQSADDDQIVVDDVENNQDPDVIADPEGTPDDGNTDDGMTDDGLSDDVITDDDAPVIPVDDGNQNTGTSGDDIFEDDPNTPGTVPGGTGLIEDEIPDDPADEELFDVEAETEIDLPDSFDEYAILRMRITEFLTLEELVRKYQYSAYLENNDLSELNERDISDGLAIFEDELSAKPSEKRGTIQEFTDAYGLTREVRQYVLSSETIAALDELERKYAGTDSPFYSKNAQVNLYKGYLNLLAYDLILKGNKLEQAVTTAGIDLNNATAQQIEPLRAQINAASDAFYRFDVNRKLILSILDNYTFSDAAYELSDEEIENLTKEYEKFGAPFAGSNLKLGDTSEGFLSILIGRLNDTDVVQETEPVTEPATEAETTPPTEQITENYGDYDDYGDDYYGDDEEGEDEETLEETLRNERTAIVETKLSIRENELKVKEYKRKLAQQTVKATMNGIVKSAGTVSQPSADDYFIVISGEKGMYVEGTVSELELETIKVGDKVTGSSWGGETFTATITEISEYPQSDNGGYYYGYGDSGNTNVSRYPFTAYIEEDVDLDEGYVTMQFVSGKAPSSGIALENQFIRTDEQGRDYVMKADENGVLKKQIVTTAPMPYMDSDSQQIKAGLTLEDKIAFPYGKGVVEGAQTVEAQSLDDLYIQ